MFDAQTPCCTKKSGLIVMAISVLSFVYSLSQHWRIDSKRRQTVEQHYNQLSDEDKKKYTSEVSSPS